MVVPKAAIYQTQAFYAKGKMKEVKQLVANLRGDSLSSGKTETWDGKLLKIPPVSPSILDCSIIRVEYALMVRSGSPGLKCTDGDKKTGRSSLVLSELCRQSNSWDHNP